MGTKRFRALTSVGVTAGEEVVGNRVGACPKSQHPPRLHRHGMRRLPPSHWLLICLPYEVMKSLTFPPHLPVFTAINSYSVTSEDDVVGPEVGGSFGACH